MEGVALTHFYFADAIKHLGLWEVKARPPVTIHIDYPDYQISFSDSFHADPDYPMDSYVN